MSNANGLLGITSVANTGAADANIWARKQAPVVVSPLSIMSPDQTKTASVQVNNGGDTIIVPDPAGELYLGLGNVYFASPNQTQNAQLVVDNNGDFGLYQSGVGATVYLGGATGRVALCHLDSTPIVNIGSQNGLVYDTVYNPVYTISLLNNNTTGNVVYDQTASRAAGVYQLQLSIEGAVPTNLSMLDIFCIGAGTQVINFSGSAINAAAVSLQQNVCLNSGYFTHAGGNLRVVVQAVEVPLPSPPAPPVIATPWTGTWSLQLVKIG